MGRLEDNFAQLSAAVVAPGGRHRDRLEAALGSLLALQERAKSGKGQFVEAAYDSFAAATAPIFLAAGAARVESALVATDSETTPTGAREGRPWSAPALSRRHAA